MRSAPKISAGEMIRKSGSDSDHLLIAAMGASAGGLEAFEHFFKQMPSDSGIAFIIVQHLAPDHSSALPQLLSKYTQMRVEQASDNGEVAPNHVYVIPPGTTLTIKDCRLHLDAPVEPRGRRAPIDSLFRSLAQDRGENAVCILLSGTGTDGTLGLREIKEYGGMAMAQTIESAKYGEILKSAISTGLVDHVLPVEEMPQKLLEYAAYLKSLEGKPVHIREEIGRQLSRIHALLHRKAGHDFSEYKESTIARRLERRMKALQIDTVEHYVQTLARDPGEADQLFKDLLIGVTQFFRDPEAFAALESEVVPNLFKGKTADDEVRACVVGCASGEEAYSIAMLLFEHASTLDNAPRIKILATDIDERGLEIARKGLYPDGVAEHLTPERLERFFAKKHHSFQVKRELRDICIFSNHSFIKDPPFSRLGLISCRNVMIYLGSDLQRKMIPLFHYALSPGGYLFLGPAESAGSSPELFRVRNKKHRIFQKKDTAARTTANFSFRDFAGQRQPGEKAREAQEGSLSTQLERLILERYRPACVAVNESGDAVYFSGRTGQYLEQPTGNPQANVINMAREGLRIPLRMTLHRAASTHQRAIEKGISVPLNGGAISVDVTVEPLEGYQLPNLYMIVFEESVAGHSKQPRAAAKRDTDYEETIRRLESELRAAHEHEQAAFEELETTNEELKSANEEYQSTNEELETSKEELQSYNEELETVNAELNHKISELDEMNSILQNLFNSTQIASIFLDSQLRIKSFTPAADTMFRLIATDVGRPITDLAPRFADGDFVDDISKVLKTLSLLDRQLAGEDGRSYQMRILPYRTVHNVIDGVVITFTDVTDITEIERKAKEAETRAVEAKEYADSIIRTVREPLLVLDHEQRVKSANASFYETFQVTPSETEDKLLYELGNGQWDIPNLRRMLAEILPRQKSFNNFRVEHDFQDIGRRTMLLNARMLRQQAGAGELVFLAIEDFTEQAQFERARISELDSTRCQLQWLTARLMRTEEDERRRLARDLHDDLAQKLALIEIELQMVQKSQSTTEIGSQLEPIRRRVSSLSDEVRALSHQLHPGILEDLGLEAALRNLVEEFDRIRNLAIHLTFDLHRPVPLPVATALYRITQEALGNTAKHAPGALVEIRVTETSEAVQLSVTDTGPGFDQNILRAKRGLGIVSMKERARQVGGELKIQSIPGGGTQITVAVPLRDGGEIESPAGGHR